LFESILNLTIIIALDLDYIWHGPPSIFSRYKISEHM